MGGYRHTEGMDIAAHLIEITTRGMITVPIILVALTSWAALASGLAGRIALLVEELPHRSSARRIASSTSQGVRAEERPYESPAPLRLAA